MASQYDLKQCTFKLIDGDSPATELEYKIADGGLNFRVRRNITFRRNRGLLEDVLLGDEIPVEVSMDITLEDLKSLTTDSEITPYEFLTKRYAGASLVTVGDACQPYAVDIEILRTAPCAGEDDETITLPEFRVDRIDGGLRDATLKVTGRCNVTLAEAVRS